MKTIVDQVIKLAGVAAQGLEDTAEDTADRASQLGTFVAEAVGATVASIIAKEESMVDEVLDRLGLQRRTSPLVPMAWFAAGAVVAGSLAVLFAPEGGPAIRERLVRGMADTIRKAAKLGDAAVDEGKKAIRSAGVEADRDVARANDVAKREVGRAVHTNGQT